VVVVVVVVVMMRTFFFLFHFGGLARKNTKSQKNKKIKGMAGEGRAARKGRMTVMKVLGLQSRPKRNLPVSPPPPYHFSPSAVGMKKKENKNKSIAVLCSAAVVYSWPRSRLVR
jgi:hypothetical protein